MPRTKKTAVSIVESAPAEPAKPDREIGFAVVGCGVIGPWHAGAIARVEGARLVACVDTNKEKAQKLSNQYAQWLKDWGLDKPGQKKPAVYSSHKAMLKREDVDVVCVCVPSGDHAKIGIDAAKAGKHIISEKPLDITLTKMDAFIAAAKENNVKLAAIFQRRFVDNSIRIKDAIEAGKLGKIVQADCTIKWYRSQEYYDSGDWRGTWELDGGGCLMNQGVHGVDLLQWLAGPVEWVQSWAATTDRKRIEVETQAIAIVGFKNGAHGVIQGSTVCWPGEPIIHQIWGTKGCAGLHDERLAMWKFMKPAKGDDTMLQVANDPQAKAAAGSDPMATLGKPGDTHYPQIKDMADAIREGRAPKCTGDDARHAVEIILAIYESARRGGERIFLPLEGDFAATGFPKDRK